MSSSICTLNLHKNCGFHMKDFLGSTVVSVAFACCYPSYAAEISRFMSTSGSVQLNETNGRALLRFDQSGKIATLPADWRETSIERVVSLNKQATGVVISYASGVCASRQALMVITPTMVAGPYQLGGCEDSLAYQVSNDRDAFVAIRTDAQPVMAWVYNANTREFRGPATVTLPNSLARLVPASTNHLMQANPLRAVITPPVNLPSALPSTPLAGIAAEGEAQISSITAPKRSAPAHRKSTPFSQDDRVAATLPDRDYLRADVVEPVVTRTASTAPSRRKTIRPSDDVADVSQQVRQTTKAQPQVTIDLR